MSKRFLSLVVLLVLVTVTLFYIALTKGVETTEDCKFYSNYSVSQIPVKCLE